MSATHWIISKAVALALAQIKLDVQRPQGYDDALLLIENRYTRDIVLSTVDFDLLNRESHNLVASALIVKLIAASGVRLRETPATDIDEIAKGLANHFVELIEKVAKQSSPQERAVYNNIRGRESAISDALLGMFVAEWRRALRALLKQESEANVADTGIEDLGQEGFLISHITDIPSAKSIVNENFSVVTPKLECPLCAKLECLL